MLWRGIDRWGGIGTKELNFSSVVPKDNRETLNTPQLLNDLMDDLLEERFGWRPRKEGVFAYQTPTSSYSYGEPYMIFPVDGFKYVWSPKIKDFFLMFSKYPAYDFNIERLDDVKRYLNYYNKLDRGKLEIYYNEYIKGFFDMSLDEWFELMTPEGIKAKLKIMSDTYIDKWMKKLLISDEREILIKCDKYYCIGEKWHMQVKQNFMKI